MDNRGAFLMMIRACEGTAGPDGYRMLFGGHIFDDMSQHPNVAVRFQQTDGTWSYTTAAGAYQFLYRIWLSLIAKLGLHDFTPPSQDAGAIELVKEAGALGMVDGGDLQGAINRCSRIWASLPASFYPQPRRTFAFASQAYVGAGGTIT